MPALMVAAGIKPSTLVKVVGFAVAVQRRTGPGQLLGYVELRRTSAVL